MQEEFIKTIATFTGKTVEEVTKQVIADEKVNAEALQTMLREKLNSVITPEEKLTELKDNFYKKGQIETYKKVKDGMKTIYPKLEISEDAKFEDILTSIKQLKVELPDEEKIKASPVYVQLEQSINENYVKKDEYLKKENEFESYKRQIDRSKKTDVLKSVMKDILSKEYKLPESPQIAERQLSAFGMVFDGYELEEIPNKQDFILIDKDGKRLEDADKNLITAKRKIEMDAPTFFEKKVAGKPNPIDDPNKGQHTPTKDKDGKFTFAPPSSVEEFEKTREKMSGEERIAYKTFGTDVLKEKGLL